MPFNGSGSYSPPGASFPAVSGAVIDSTKYNNVVNDIASALTNCVTKDGQTATVSDQAMGGYKHTGVGDAVARNNYASMGQVQDNAGIWGGTATGTADAITLTLTPAISAYTAGQEFIYKSGSSANTGAMTVNVNSVGAKAIQKNGVAPELVDARWEDFKSLDIKLSSLSLSRASGLFLARSKQESLFSTASPSIFAKW